MRRHEVSNHTYSQAVNKSQNKQPYGIGKKIFIYWRGLLLLNEIIIRITKNSRVIRFEREVRPVRIN